jgi:hypothetical protein
MSAATHFWGTDKPHAHLNSSREQLMMVIQDNDLANVIQAERRCNAAHERLLHESVRTARDRAPRFNLYRLGAAWLRAQMAGRLPVFSAIRRSDPSSLESI